jgi:hypothetical protein
MSVWFTDFKHKQCIMYVLHDRQIAVVFHAFQTLGLNLSHALLKPAFADSVAQSTLQTSNADSYMILFHHHIFENKSIIMLCQSKIKQHIAL